MPGWAVLRQHAEAERLRAWQQRRREDALPEFLARCAAGSLLDTWRGPRLNSGNDRQRHGYVAGKHTRTKQLQRQASGDRTREHLRLRVLLPTVCPFPRKDEEPPQPPTPRAFMVWWSFWLTGSGETGHLVMAPSPHGWLSPEAAPCRPVPAGSARCERQGAAGGGFRRDAPSSGNTANSGTRTAIQPWVGEVMTRSATTGRTSRTYSR
ncbi:MAG: hypothetical protein HY689_12935 [Chloroflexi bacterium]|nr:hypothetical protein [Chloroflexota bacterium]